MRLNQSKMPSQRRTKIFFLAVLTAVFFILYYTSDARRIQNQKFYQSTVEAMDARAAAKDSASDDSGLFQKLQPNRAPVDKEALKLNREKFDVPSKDDTEEMEEISVAGRTKMHIPKPKESKPAQKKEESEDDPELKSELNGILKRSPIIVFSKSYCPFSAKAKNILNNYSIVPAPFVVELDEHPLGAKLQALLAKNTGRSTVPNILVNGRSIGGGDDIAALDKDNKLASKLKSYGGKRIMEIVQKAQKEV